MNQINYSRQLQGLQMMCTELISEDGVFRNGAFYQKLEDFINFFEEIMKAFQILPNGRKRRVFFQLTHFIAS